MIKPTEKDISEAWRLVESFPSPQSLDEIKEMAKAGTLDKLGRAMTALAITLAKLRIAIETLEKISNCSEKDCEKYVAKVDIMAIDGLIKINN